MNQIFVSEECPANVSLFLGSVLGVREYGRRESVGNFLAIISRVFHPVTRRLQARLSRFPSA